MNVVVEVIDIIIQYIIKENILDVILQKWKKGQKIEKKIRKLRSLLREIEVINRGSKYSCLRKDMRIIYFIVYYSGYKGYFEYIRIFRYLIGDLIFWIFQLQEYISIKIV